MSDKIREIQEKFNSKFQGKNEENVAASAYIPLFGWIYPYYFSKEQALCHFHGKQALQLNVAIVLLYFVIWLLEYFPLTSIFFGVNAILHPITRTIWLVSIFGYISVSGIGAYRALSGESWPVPYLQKVVTMIWNFIKSLKKSD